MLLTTRMSKVKVGDYYLYPDVKLGFGNYATVFLGSSTTFKTQDKTILSTFYENVVAIKKINTVDLHPKIKKTISEEINIMRKIINNPHPNIVSCYDVIDDIDHVYIVMEFCDHDLSRCSGKRYTEDVIVYYFTQLIHGIKYLNDNKIVHRDIKPKNILLTNDKKELKLCDFGLAKDMNNIHRSSTICGSPLYMAPEFFKDTDYDETVDIWSVGIILFEFMFGINPFYRVKDKHELEQFMISCNDVDVPKNDYSHQLNILLKSLLQKDAKKRMTFNELYNYEWTDKSEDEKGEKDEEIFVIEC